MLSSPVDRMSAIILAKSIVNRREVLALRGEIETYVNRLASYRLFSVGELAEIADLSEYRVRKSCPSDTLLRARSGVAPRHLESLLRMVDNPTFSRTHARRLVEDGATPAAMARITGHPESSLRRWAR